MFSLMKSKENQSNYQIIKFAKFILYANLKLLRSNNLIKIEDLMGLK